MVAQLIGTFGEAHRGAGLAGPRAIYEIWASDATGSWTIIVVAPGGRACVIAAGDYWTDTRPEAPGRRSGLTIPGGVSSLSRGLVDARAPRPGPTTARPLLSGGPR
jgi:hypothetical protein